MAEIPATKIPFRDIDTFKVSWLALSTGNATGEPVEMPNYADRSIQVTGTFGTGGEVTIEGSNDDGITWASLTDPQGNTLMFAAAKIEAVTELPHMIRPHITGGDGSTNLNAYLFMRKTH